MPNSSTSKGARTKFLYTVKWIISLKLLKTVMVTNKYVQRIYTGTCIFFLVSNSSKCVCKVMSSHTVLYKGSRIPQHHQDYHISLI